MKSPTSTNNLVDLFVGVGVGKRFHCAAAVNGHVMSHSGVHGNRNLNGQSMDQAHQPGGVWSKSHTVTHDRQGELTSRTKSMAHEPGGPPVKSTTGSSVNLGQ